MLRRPLEARPAAPPLVIHVITKLELGGAQEVTLHAVERLHGVVGEMRLLAGTGGMLDDEARARLGERLEFVPALVRPVRPGLDAVALRALSRRLGEAVRAVRGRPVIVHTHSSKAGILGRWAARLAGVHRILHSIHGFGFHDQQTWAARRLFVGLERLTGRITDGFTADGAANLRRAEAVGILHPRHLARVVRCAIDLEACRRIVVDREAKRAALGVPAHAPLVGMVACLKPQKAPLDFARVAARVRAQHPAAHFVLVGDGELREALEREIDRLELRGAVHLLGWRRDVPEILHCLDLLLHTSLWEGLPRTIPEARAAGLPVVATRVDGIPEAVRDGVNGFLCPPGDLEAMAARVAQVLADGGLRRRLAAAAGEGLEEFSLARMERDLAAVYRELLAE